KRPAMFALALMLVAGATGAAAQGQGSGAAAPLRIRYMVNDVPSAVAFYTGNLGFKLLLQSGPYFAVLTRGDAQLLLSPVKGPGGASQPMPNGERPAPGGWNRMVLY